MGNLRGMIEDAIKFDDSVYEILDDESIGIDDESIYIDDDGYDDIFEDGEDELDGEDSIEDWDNMGDIEGIDDIENWDEVEEIDDEENLDEIEEIDSIEDADGIEDWDEAEDEENLDEIDRIEDAECIKYSDGIEDDSYNDGTDITSSELMYNDGIEDDIEVNSSIEAITILKDRCNKLIENRDELQDRIECLTADKNDLENEVVELEGMLADLKGKYNELGSKYNDLMNKYKSITIKYSKLKSENDKLGSISKQAIKDTLDSKINEGEKVTKDKQDDNVSDSISKIDYYSSLSIDKLYEILAKYLREKGVDKAPVDKSVLVEEFGAGNINKLIVRSYLVPLGAKVTMGKVVK